MNKKIEKYMTELNLNIVNQFPNKDVNINIEPEKDLIIGSVCIRLKLGVKRNG